MSNEKHKYNNEGKKRPVSSSAVVRLVIWLVVLCLLVSAFSVAMLSNYGLSGLCFDDDFDDGDYQVGNGSTQTTVTGISIDWVGGGVTVVATDGEEIRITENYEGDKESHRMRWQVEDGELSVKYCRAGLSTNKLEAKYLTVEIPRSALDRLTELHVSAVTATQDIRVSARELEIETVSGCVTVRGEYDSVDAETVSGELNFEGTFREGAFEGVSGKMNIRLKKEAANLDVETVSGSVHLILPEETTGFCVNADSISGDVDVRGFSFDYAGSERWGDGSMDIRMDSISSKLLIEKETGD